MIAPEAMNPVTSHLLPVSSMELLTQLLKKWKDWKMSEVDDIVQTQARTNHSQEWAKQRSTFLEEKHGLSLLTGKRKPNVPQVELREAVPIGAIKMSEMTGADTESADRQTDGHQEEYPRASSSTVWDEAHLLRLMVPKGKTDYVDKIVNIAVGVGERNTSARQAGALRERRAGGGTLQLEQRYDREIGGHGSEGLRVEGERWWIASSDSGREGLLKWSRLLQQTAAKENMELGAMVWGTSGLQEPATTSTIRAQLTTTSDLNEVPSIIEANLHPEGLLERRIVWGAGPWRETNMLRAWEMILEGKAYAKRPQCGNCTDCKGHPVPISTTVKGMGSIRSFCQSCWAWSDFHEHRPAPLSMDFMTEWGIFKTRLARPDKGGLRGKLTKEELDKVLATYVKGRLSPGPDGVISELLKDATSTERSVILQWINEVLTSEDPGLKLSVKEVHGLVALLHKGGGSTVRAENYRPVVLLNSLFQLVSYIIQERLVRIVEGSGILEPGQGGFRARRGCDINVHKLDFITREAQKKTSLRTDRCGL